MLPDILRSSIVVKKKSAECFYSVYCKHSRTTNICSSLNCSRSVVFIGHSDNEVSKLFSASSITSIMRCRLLVCSKIFNCLYAEISKAFPYQKRSKYTATKSRRHKRAKRQWRGTIELLMKEWRFSVPKTQITQQDASAQFKVELQKRVEKHAFSIYYVCFIV